LHAQLLGRLARSDQFVLALERRGIEDLATTSEQVAQMPTLIRIGVGGRDTRAVFDWM